VPFEIDATGRRERGGPPQEGKFDSHSPRKKGEEGGGLLTIMLPGEEKAQGYHTAVSKEPCKKDGRKGEEATLSKAQIGGGEEGQRSSREWGKSKERRGVFDAL